MIFGFASRAFHPTNSAAPIFTAARRVSTLKTIPDIHKKLGEESAGHRTAIPSLGSAVCDSSDCFSPKVAGQHRRLWTRGSIGSTRTGYHMVLA